ncbi:hypothetical protein [Nocardia carnea]|uniref:hypothetical protein n=1 Tax=Nocardia carnea TaxID=37328 RepID=UPI002456619B|nr:hypothetical protein [Nocardia carnea]
MTDTNTNNDLAPNPRRHKVRTPLLAAAASAAGCLIGGALQELGARLIELFW